MPLAPIAIDSGDQFVEIRACGLLRENEFTEARGAKNITDPFVVDDQTAVTPQQDTATDPTAFRRHGFLPDTSCQVRHGNKAGCQTLA